MNPKRISIIVPSFNDQRIAHAIASVRTFDDIGTVRLVVIDGGSKPEICELIRSLLAEGDIFVSERDKGIFDALNKGLDNSTTDFIGWIGCDDLYTGRVLASDVIRTLEMHDIFVTNHAMFTGNTVRRITHSLPSRLGLVKYGLNNPHYATFGRAKLLKSERFRLDLLGSDIEYFINVFDKRPRVATSRAIAMLGREGGYSTKSYERTYNIHRQLFHVYASHTNFVTAFFAMTAKTIYRLSNTLYYRVFTTRPSAYLKDKSLLSSPEAYSGAPN